MHKEHSYSVGNLNWSNLSGEQYGNMYQIF